ncbi:hypothetical protein ABBQ32_011968 [Trebouxia sp. C0010 RCD-2024]
MPVFSAQGAASVEVYGFTGWITTGVAYGAFLCWAYLPEQALQAVGITYYPDKYWALAVPTWVCVAIVAAAWAYESWNASLVLPLESIRNLQGIQVAQKFAGSTESVASNFQQCTLCMPSQTATASHHPVWVCPASYRTVHAVYRH